MIANTPWFNGLQEWMLMAKQLKPSYSEINTISKMNKEIISNKRDILQMKISIKKEIWRYSHPNQIHSKLNGSTLISLTLQFNQLISISKWYLFQKLTQLTISSILNLLLISLHQLQKMKMVRNIFTHPLSSEPSSKVHSIFYC